MPLVSIIIPTYNRKEHVQQAIDSVLAQTHTDYEIIVIDEGSSDCAASMVNDILWSPEVSPGCLSSSLLSMARPGHNLKGGPKSRVTRPSHHEGLRFAFAPISGLRTPISL